MVTLADDRRCAMRSETGMVKQIHGLSVVDLCLTTVDQRGIDAVKAERNREGG